MPISDLRIGPSETGALSVGFWPDPRGFTQRALSGLIADKDPIAQDPDAYADVSIAARGLFALDMLLYDPAFSDYTTQSYTCALVTTIAVDLASQKPPRPPPKPPRPPNPPPNPPRMPPP